MPRELPTNGRFRLLLGPFAYSNFRENRLRQLHLRYASSTFNVMPMSEIFSAGISTFRQVSS
jgi:hypothetical protein